MGADMTARALSHTFRGLAFVTLLAGAAACQDQRNEFNPVRIFCPGDFDPVTNECRIETGGAPEKQ